MKYPDSQRCRECGKEDAPSRFANGHAKQVMTDERVCFSCALWTLRARGGKLTVVNGHAYTPGSRTSGPRGMGGRRFDIEYFDGRRITTFDLWSGGEIPAHFRDRMPDTARFLDAEKVQVGQGSEWSATPNDRPCYPLPDGRLVEGVKP